MKPQEISDISMKRLRWRLQEFLNAEGSPNPITAADGLLDVIVGELLQQPPDTPANLYGNDLRRSLDRDK